ncbi:hypothetical protein [Streptomyces sp. NPDC008150]|uniref:hypothetical protein n=1 Tax=Streptomyces sp. NPDC008150 TaxID=3364816 RepID=UPI0036EEFBBB
MSAEQPLLADLEQAAIAAVDVEFARRGHGIKPWTCDEYVNRVEAVHVRYNHRRRWLAAHPQEAAA